MNIHQGRVHCLTTPIDHDDIIAYSIATEGCLYLTSDGNTHYVNLGESTYISADFVNQPDAIDVYLFNYGSYILVFRDRMEIYQVGTTEPNIIEINIRPDFQLFRSSGLISQFCYINDGMLYDSCGKLVMKMPNYKFIWKLESVSYILNNVFLFYMNYVDHDGNSQILSTRNGLPVISITHAISTDAYDVYNKITINTPSVILHHHHSNRAIECYCPEMNPDVCQFETDGYVAFASNGVEKVYLYKGMYYGLPIDCKLYGSSHHAFTRVPTKSARF